MLQSRHRREKIFGLAPRIRSTATQGPRLGRGGRLEQGESAAWAALGTVDQIDDARVTGRFVQIVR